MSEEVFNPRDLGTTCHSMASELEMPEKSYKGLVWLLALVCLGILQVQAVDHPNVNPSSFCYDEEECGPSTWEGLCASGRQQSPIDIITPPDILRMLQPTSFYLNDKYATKEFHRFYAQNNGHSVQFEMNRDTAALRSDFCISGGGLSDSYSFAQLHFHWGEGDDQGSEHTLNGQRFPMELHVVHYRRKYESLADALAANDREAVAVMAVFFEIGSQDNEALRGIVTVASGLRNPGNVTEYSGDLQLSSLYPNHGLEAFVTHLGSLTTPSCDEKVIWTLDPVSISLEQFLEGSGTPKAYQTLTFGQFNPEMDEQRDFMSHPDFSILTTYSKIWFCCRRQILPTKNPGTILLQDKSIPEYASLMGYDMNGEGTSAFPFTEKLKPLTEIYPKHKWCISDAWH